MALGKILIFTLPQVVCGQAGPSAPTTNPPDSNYIRQFDLNNVMEVFPGIYSTQLGFTNSFNNRKNFRLVVNRSAYTGVYLTYKWLWFKYSWAVPGTYLDKNIKQKYNDLQLMYSHRNMSFRPFFESYNGLLYRPSRRAHNFSALPNIQYSALGLEFFYFLNKKRFSFGAANYFSEKQIKSSGSFLIKILPQWQKMDWQNPSHNLIHDSLTYHLLSSNPAWLSLTTGIGYQHNFAIQKGRYSIVPAVVAGPGLVKELDFTKNSIHAAYNLQTWLTAGYNGPRWYCYFNGNWNYLKTNLLIRNMNKTSSDMSLTFGYRFGNYKHKILNIL